MTVLCVGALLWFVGGVLTVIWSLLQFADQDIDTDDLAARLATALFLPVAFILFLGRGAVIAVRRFIARGLGA